ncbi:hypothetical protein E6O75_ATG00755 [Venturia nashicola]|uniref:Nuclear pore complex protein n=1 Tax=Venturia nashicola TaxID=86259 RepID=A0A4Z1PUK1_9PEZI|nr:hypothetical protein E6O75_ATG00755 [Venturia nashicola]
MDSRMRSQHPRRLSKVAGQPSFRPRPRPASNTRSLFAREESWEQPDQSTSPFNHAQESPESPLFPNDAPLQETLDSVRAMGERIGLQVEQFAQFLDQWNMKRNTMRADDNKANKEAAMELIDRLKDVSSGKLKNLERHHQTGDLSSSWRGRLEGVADRAGRASIRPETAMTAYGASGDLDELHQWQSEVNSWDLFKTITNYEVNSMSAEQEAYVKDNPTDRFTEGADLWTQFILVNDLAREKKVVLEWLERCAQNGENSLEAIVEKLQEQAGAGAGTWSMGWLYTREKIKAHKRIRSVGGPIPQTASISATDSSRLLITQLDPDAPTRQERVLEKKDDYYERALWLTCYEKLRRGTTWEDISAWCEERNESWRGASLGASQELERKNSRLCLSGPNAGALWRRMCLKAAHNPTADKYERAVYGLLAGDVQSVEPVCQSWEDSLYMNYNSLLLAEFEDWLQNNHPEHFPSVLAQKYPLYKPVRPYQDLATEHDAAMMATYRQGEDCDDPAFPIKHLQAALVAHKFQDFAQELAKAIRKKANQGQKSVLIANNHMLTKVEDKFMQIAEDWDLIRLAAHMVPVYRSIGMKFDDEEAVDDIIVTYMDFLRTLGKFDAIPTYAVCLHSDATRNRIVGAMISDITDRTEQERLVKLMNAAELDMTSILSAQWVHALGVMGITVHPTMENLPGPNETIDRFELVEPAGEQWAGWRIRDTGLASLELEERSIMDLLDPSEQRLVRSLEWFFRIRADWEPTFAGIATVMKAMLRTGRFMAALAISNRISYEAMSKHLTPGLLDGRSVDVHENPEYQEPATTRPDLMKRFTRSSSQKNIPMAASNEPSKDAKEWPYRIALLKQQSKQVVELQNLCSLLEALAMWRFLEDNVAADNDQLDFSSRQELVATTLQEDIMTRMVPLFGSLLTEVADAEDEYLCMKLRYAYFPDIILAYNGIITYTSRFGEKDVLFKSLELANAIADERNYELANVFLRTKRMGELVTALALSQRMLLKLNQQELRSERKRERDLENQKRIAEGTAALFDTEGKGEVVAKEKKGKKVSLRKKKSGLLTVGQGEWVGQTVDIWAPR